MEDKERTMVDFFERAEPVFTFYEQGRYADSLRLAEELAREFPDRSVNTAYWRMCLLAVMGREHDSLQVMREAVEGGYWWAEGRLRDEIDLKDLQGNPEFERLVSICAQRHETARGNAKPGLTILEPDDLIPAPYPLLMVLHGRDGSADREKHHWKSARDQGWLVALAQSSQVGSLEAYVWDDVGLARSEIRRHFKSLQEKYMLDGNRIVLGGFSQGSGIAMLSALTGDVPAIGFIAVAPGRVIDTEELPALAEAAKERVSQGVIVAGGKDPRFEVFRQISETLSKHGISCPLEIRPELGHAYPSDFKDILKSRLSSYEHEEQE